MKNKMNNALILLGGNLANSKQAIFDAENKFVNNNCKIINSSSFYGSEAWGFDSDDFINRVIEIKTELSPHNLLNLCQQIENELGRVRNDSIGYSSRIIDVDILFYNNEIHQEESLEIPHPRLHLRRFTLEPLNEKWSDKIHPIFNKSISKLLSDCEDDGKVWLIE